MNIIVCVKRTPDSTAQIKVKSDGSDIEREVEWILNPYDELAVEEALKLREKFQGKVTALSVDPDGNNSILRRCLAIGVDEAILLKGGRNFDPFPVAKALAEELKGLNADLVLFGKQAIDEDNYQVPTITAQLLGMPFINVVTKLEIADKKITATRQIEGGDEIIETECPCIISCQRGLNEPRYPSLKGIMMAKKKEIPVKEVGEGDATLTIKKFEPPQPRPEGRIIGEGADAVKELVRLLKEEAKVL